MNIQKICVGQSSIRNLQTKNNEHQSIATPINPKHENSANNIIANYNLSFLGIKKSSNEAFDEEIRKESPSEDKLIKLIKKTDFNPNADMKNVYIDTTKKKYMKANPMFVLGEKNLIKPLKVLCLHPDLNTNQELADINGYPLDSLFELVGSSNTPAVKTILENSPNVDLEKKAGASTKIYYRSTIKEHASFIDKIKNQSNFEEMFNKYEMGGREKVQDKISKLKHKDYPFLSTKNINQKFIDELSKKSPNETKIIKIMKKRDFNPNLKIENAYMNTVDSNYKEANPFCLLADRGLYNALGLLCKHPLFDINRPIYDERGYQSEPLYYFMLKGKEEIVETTFMNNPQIDTTRKASAPYQGYNRINLKDYAKYIDSLKDTHFSQIINRYENGGKKEAYTAAKETGMLDVYYAAEARA